MASILGSNLHLNVPLSNYVKAWKPPGDKSGWFARGDFFPMVPVSKPRDLIRQVSQGRMLQIYEALVGTTGPGSPGSVPTVDFALDGNLSFNCKPFALSGIVNYYDAKTADPNLQYEKRMLEQPRWSLEMFCETQAIPTLLDTANYGNNTTTLSSNEYWDNYASSASTIYDTLASIMEKIALETGGLVNRIGISLPVWRIIKGHPGLTRRPFNNQAGSTPQMLTTEIFEGLFKEWLAPGALRIYRGWYDASLAPNDDGTSNTQPNGKLFFGPGVVMANVQENVSLDDFSFAKSFMFAGLGDDEAGTMAVLEREMPEIAPIGGREIRLVTAADYKIMNPLSGWIIPQVIDTSDAQYDNPAGNSWFA